MTTESLAIIGVVLIGLALPVMGAWAYQTFALKRELDDVSKRIEDRITRAEDKMDASFKSIEHSLSDIYHLLGKLDERYPRNRP